MEGSRFFERADRSNVEDYERGFGEGINKDIIQTYKDNFPPSEEPIPYRDSPFQVSDRDPRVGPSREDLIKSFDAFRDPRVGPSREDLIKSFDAIGRHRGAGPSVHPAYMGISAGIRGPSIKEASNRMFKKWGDDINTFSQFIPSDMKNKWGQFLRKMGLTRYKTPKELPSRRPHPSEFETSPEESMGVYPEAGVLPSKSEMFSGANIRQGGKGGRWY